MDVLLESLIYFPRGLVYVLLGVVVLLLAKYVRSAITTHKEDEEVVQNQNLAEALRLSGYLIGVVLVFVGAVFQPAHVALQTLNYGFDAQFGMDVLRVFLYSLAGIVALNILRVSMNKLVLYKFDVEKEVIQDRNVGTGAVEFGVNVATGLMIAGSLAGSAGGGELFEALTVLLFLILGQVVLVLFALFYNFSSRFDVHDEIERDNVAVGVAFGGNLVAIGFVMLKALSGDFLSWQQSLTEFVIFAVLGFVLLYLLRLVVDLLVLPKVRVADQLAQGRNSGVALVESAVVVSVSLILFFAI